VTRSKGSAAFRETPHRATIRKVRYIWIQLWYSQNTQWTWSAPARATFNSDLKRRSFEILGLNENPRKFTDRLNFPCVSEHTKTRGSPTLRSAKRWLFVYYKERTTAKVQWLNVTRFSQDAIIFKFETIEFMTA
jgi:hypothetical protein